MNVPYVSAALQNTLLKLLVCVAILFGLSVWHVYDKRHAVHQERQVWVQKLEKATKAQVAVNKELQAATNQRKKEYEAQTKDLQRKLDDALVSLRHRQSRPKHLVITEVRETCTGRELYREDAEFLTREAARAEQLIEERDYYYNAYEDARLKLEALNDRQE